MSGHTDRSTIWFQVSLINQNLNMRQSKWINWIMVSNRAHLFALTTHSHIGVNKTYFSVLTMPWFPISHWRMDQPFLDINVKPTYRRWYVNGNGETSSQIFKMNDLFANTLKIQRQAFQHKSLEKTSRSSFPWCAAGATSLANLPTTRSMYTTYSPFMFSRTCKSLRALRIDLAHSSKSPKHFI